MLYILWGSKGISGKRCAHCQRQWAQCGWHRGRQCSHLLEVAEFGKCAGNSRRHRIRLAGPTFPRAVGTTNPIILLYNCYIWILLIKTNSMVYIYCTKHRGKGVVCVLTVRDNELNVGVRCVIRPCRGAGAGRLGRGKTGNRPWIPKAGDTGKCWGWQASGTPVNPQANVGNVALQFYRDICDNQVNTNTKGNCICWTSRLQQLLK